MPRPPVASCAALGFLITLRRSCTNQNDNDASIKPGTRPGFLFHRGRVPGFLNDGELQNEFSRSSSWLALAVPGCATCGGRGLDGEDHCACILRKMCRAVVRCVRDLEARKGAIRPIPLDLTSVPQGRRITGIRAVEYIADVHNAARAVLNATDFFLFRHHMLAGHEWRWCCARLGLTRGNCFHRLYVIEARLGRCFLELVPYPLFPVSTYWDTRLEKVQPCPVPETTSRRDPGPLRPPLAPRPAVPVVPPSIKERSDYASARARL